MRSALSALLLLTGLACCQKSGGDEETQVAPTETPCSGAQAISATNVYGTSLPEKTLSLSFDDGPGARTLELSAYLAAQRVSSSFFVNGQMLGEGTAILEQIVADGHVVANHTQTHRSLTGRSTGGAALEAAAVVSEIALTDALIAPFVPAKRFMFRAPFGDFDAETAAAITPSPMNKYVGPINWDVGDHMGPAQAADWDCWKPGSDGAVLTPQECGDLYVQEIEAVGRGIVLLHDPYFVDDDPAKGGTVDMIEYIVPILKTKGYKFVRIDYVPAIASLLPPAPVDAGADDAEAGSLGNAGSDSGTPATRPTNDGNDAGVRLPNPCPR